MHPFAALPQFKTFAPALAVLLGLNAQANAQAPTRAEYRGNHTFLSSRISEYKPIFGDCVSDGKRWIAIRQFKLRGSDTALVVDPLSLRTEVRAAGKMTCRKISADFAKTKYGQILESVRRQDSSLWDAGITRTDFNPHVYLTVDLCPSKKPFEARFFSWVKEQRAPVALSVSGGWINGHAQEFQWLKDLRQAGVDVTWVNHSLTHPYVKSLSDKQNFFLLPGVQVRDEILGNEIKMLENGIVPSVFFRFPGLISDREIADEIVSWGLVPLGADAWLALGKKARPGSIILVHGNGNEPRGVRLFFDDLPSLLRMGFAAITRLPSQ